MHSTSRRRLGRAAAAAALGSAALAAPAAAQQTLSASASTDSVLATGLAYGPTTIQATRPDALTGAPVVIGQYAGTVLTFLPFSVNTTTPSALNPGGDCWQPGALKLPGSAGLTPDMLPGDRVSVSNGPSVIVPPDGTPAAGSGGPVPGCGSLSAFARNAVTAATGASGTDVSVSGVAQPLATGVALSATDGSTSTPPVTGTLAADGTWTATLPVSQLTALNDGTVALDAVVAVPDVATGSPAHIAGVPLSIRKQTIGGAVSVTPTTPDVPVPGGAAPASPSAPAPAAVVPSRLGGLRATTRISLAAARRGGIHASFVVPSGARVVRVQLSRGSSTVLARVVPAASAGSRQTVQLKSSALARRLRRGSYRLSVAAGESRSRLGAALVATVRVR